MYASPLRETHMGSHSVTCHPAEVRIPPLPPAEAGILDLATPEGCNAEFTYVIFFQSQVQRPTAAPPRYSNAM